jgi:hypothetical protein
MSALQFVNAYAVCRCYGGPEEGGWWYDAGTPLASIPAVTDEDIAAAKTRLWTLLGADYGRLPTGEPDLDSDHRDRSSVIGDDDLEIYIEDECAAPFPDRRPHYE